MTTTGKPTDHIVIRSLQFIENESVATVDCTDFDTYQNLPDALLIGETVYGKTGWSSDTNHACYKSKVNMAKPAVVLTGKEEVALRRLFESYEASADCLPGSLRKLRLLLEIRNVI